MEYFHIALKYWSVFKLQERLSEMSGGANMRPIILASASPRRAKILRQIGIEFFVFPSNIPEELHLQNGIHRSSAVAARELALSKARHIAGVLQAGGSPLLPGNFTSDDLVLGADTIVVTKDKILGKPSGPDEAIAMLEELSGKTHTVITGIALVTVSGKNSRVMHDETAVEFRRLTETEIRAYVATGEPMDKAGAYGIQGKGALLVQRINGCYFNVVGLPVSKLSQLLEEFGLNIW